ncbi:hypothetical protein BIY23_00810 [Wolbachia pipientis]|uniref:Uncharacterized protein n=1 Tax=Wolbachia pipientis TaxID=955 RepID=A0A1E7QKY8_WOLPI|nr:hypothetical protein [Wolbachia pipientis]OEY87016.1 hypothetical protein BIY23_00810 [Wolbachia pipientis]
MPQLDILTFSSQIFWFFISFYLLFLVVNHIFLPKLEIIMFNRRREVLNDFSCAMYILECAESQVIQYNKVLNQVEERIKNAMSDALMQIEKMKADVESQLEEENKKMVQFVKEETQNFQVKHVSKLKQIADNIALIYYAKLTNSEVVKGKFLLSKKS